MDSRTFDRLVAEAARRATRRSALRLLAGGLVGGLLAGRGLSAAAQRADGDGDGLFDDDETAVYGTDPFTYDSDGDGVGDGEEVYYGTDPIKNEAVAPIEPIAPAPAPAPDPVLIDCRAVGVGCDSDLQCCAGTLCCFDGVTLTTRCTDVAASGFVCPGDTPIPAGGCGAGLVDCADGRGCVDLANDAFNCGVCGNSCGLNQYCQNRTCVGLSCFDGTVDCGVGFCVNLQTDFNHCGNCGNFCGEGPCVGGQCTAPGGSGGGDAVLTCDEEYKAEFGEPPIAPSTCEDFD